MRPTKRKVIIIAAACLAAGLFISFAASAVMGFDFVQMGTMKPASYTYELTEPFTDIYVWGGECDVRLLPSSDGACTVQCGETDRITHTVAVENGTLTIRRTDDRKWYEHIGFFWNYWGKIEVVIYLPESRYESLYIRTVSGDVEVPDNFAFAKAEVDGTSGDVRFAAAVTGDLKVKTVSGDLRVGGVQPRSLTAKTTSGDLLLDRVQTGDLTAESTSGNVTVESAQVKSAFSAKTVSGDMDLAGITCRSAELHTTSGDADLSDLVAAEELRAESVSGNIELARCDAGSLWFKTVSGDVTGTLLTEKIFITDTTSGSVHVPGSDAGGKCEIKTTSGDIRLMIQP